MYPRNVVCFEYVIVNTLVDVKTNNNNNKIKITNPCNRTAGFMSPVRNSVLEYTNFSLSFHTRYIYCCRFLLCDQFVM